MPGIDAQLNTDGTQTITEPPPKPLSWKSLIWARDTLEHIQETLSLYNLTSDPNALQTTHIHGLLTLLSDWQTTSWFSYAGPPTLRHPLTSLHPLYLLFCAYRYILGILIDGLEQRPTIWGIYGWGNWDIDMRRLENIEVYGDVRISIPSTKRQFIEQLDEKTLALHSRIEVLVPRRSRPPEDAVIDFEPMMGVHLSAVTFIRSVIVEDEIWASKLCTRAKMGEAAWLKDE
ncbi:hypothetical protein DFH27DRAFT_606455 [Peziza echinospora]|nr:hypothetical protein DFH27DRAFT_606455 [Peziza echinospora]